MINLVSYVSKIQVERSQLSIYWETLMPSMINMRFALITLDLPCPLSDVVISE
jgi:hypothetical protein